MRCRHDVRICAARAARNDALLHLQTLWGDLIRQTEFDILAFRQACGFLFYFAQDVAEIRVQFVNLKRVARVEWQRDHRLYGGKVYIDQAVVVCHVGRL